MLSSDTPRSQRNGVRTNGVFFFSFTHWPWGGNFELDACSAIVNACTAPVLQSDPFLHTLESLPLVSHRNLPGWGPVVTTGGREKVVGEKNRCFDHRKSIFEKIWPGRMLVITVIVTLTGGPHLACFTGSLPCALPFPSLNLNACVDCVDVLCWLCLAQSLQPLGPKVPGQAPSRVPA